MEELSELSFEEQKDFFICQISGSLKEQETFSILALFTARNINGELYLKYFGENTDNEIESILNSYFYSNYDEEDIAWECTIKTLEVDKILDIIDNIDDYVNECNKIENQLQDIKEILFKSFTDIKR